jgi:alpha-glucosidase (family GH31 glycosyl hydrolase)
MKTLSVLLLSFVCSCLLISCSTSQTGKISYLEQLENEIHIKTNNDYSLRVKFYTNNCFRIQWAKPGEAFFPDNRYEMVQLHDKKGNYEIHEFNDYFIVKAGDTLGTKIKIQKDPVRISILSGDDNEKNILENSEIQWTNNEIKVAFAYDDEEHFAGLGYPSYGWVESLDLKGKTVSSNYGDGKIRDWGPQGVLTVPFFISSKGYGIFLNSTHKHLFNFGSNSEYSISIDTKGFEGQMDYFFIYGPSVRTVLNEYTSLTGKPRLPQQSIFGLQLSDKGSPEHNGEAWWKNKITEHRNAGFPFDHMVNDNRWRAGTGAWSGSWFEWDSTRCANPMAYAEWCKQNGISVTLDFNRNNAALCEGWKEEYNLPSAINIEHIEHGESAPDYTNPAVRKWLWEVFYNNSLNPSLKYPGDALWIDETDNLHEMHDTIICANGRSWAENANYYPFLIAKAIVQEGWDSSKGIGIDKRPYVWIRSATAGGQRYATHWTGDLKCEYDWMKTTIRAMQASGLSGFPYFNHDAGGFRAPGPEDHMYIQWAMAFGSFSPIWRPHGMGENKRWPLDRSEECQQFARIYGNLRYTLMPYLYTYAHQAHKTGLPIARAMLIDYTNKEEAWQYDLQYMWGDEMLIAPNYTGSDTTLDIWLPEGIWYDYWTQEKINGDSIIAYEAKFGFLPIFIRAGAIIPAYNFAKSTAFIDKSELVLDIYFGKDGEFILYEDDNVSELFRTDVQYRTTKVSFNNDYRRVEIHPAKGSYKSSIEKRSYLLRFHGYQNMNRIKLEPHKDVVESYWDPKQQVFHVKTTPLSVYDSFVFELN